MTFPPDMGPLAPERNPPIVPQYYRPGVYFITALSLGNTTTVNTNVANQYVIGQLVRFVIPSTYKTTQLNERSGYIISITSPTQFTTNIDSIGFDAFNASPSYGPTKPQVIAIGDVNTGAINDDGRKHNGRSPPGSFKTTSPIEGTWLN